MCVEDVHGIEGGSGLHREGQIATAGSEDRADADAGGVEQCTHLLRPGARRGNDPDPARPHHVGEAEPDAADDRRAAVGSHDQEAATVSLVLQSDLLIHRRRCR